MGGPAGESRQEGKGKAMATTVIIPARNEEATIGAIVRVFDTHRETSGHVYVGIDADTTDKTSAEVWKNGGCAIHTSQRGKGQVVNAVLSKISSATGSELNRIILCDGDYTGLDVHHVQRILRQARGMVIGIPDWPAFNVPAHVMRAWSHISGFRCLPRKLIPEDAHGYLLETQINILAIKKRVPVILAPMQGLHSPFRWPLSDKRMGELQRDKKWGEEHGIL